MKCPLCQHENKDSAKFCENCAAPLSRVCTNCGHQFSQAAKFCSECAHPVIQIAPAASLRFSSPATYIPKHLADRILTSRTAIEGERKQVTVLFADLKGSMELLADRDPEDARKLLDPLLERMMEAVHRYEGTVNQVMGDGIMALFGAPLAHEDHAVRACYAALWMQDIVGNYSDDLRRTHGVEVQIRIGINSGEVVVRSIGSDLHIDYTAVGQTVHLAARMEQLAEPGTVFITAPTLELARGYVEVLDRGPMRIKGLLEPISVYQLKGGYVRTRLQAAAARGLTQFVGRDLEMDQLHRAWELSGSGYGQIVTIVGDPGVGKSRLCWEFMHSHLMQGWLLLESCAVSYTKATPYFVVTALLRSYFNIDDRDTPQKVQEKVSRRLLSVDSALEPHLPAFLSLLDSSAPDPRWERLDPPQRKLRTLEAVNHLLHFESLRQPLLVLVENLQWVDAETQSTLDHIIENLPGSRILLLLSYRPEYQHGWGNKTYYRQLLVDTLSEKCADELLRSLVGNDVSLASLKRLLIDRTEGNPLYLEESVKGLVETQVLRGEHGAYQIQQPLKGIQIPPTVQSIIAARIDRLHPEDKSLLQSASVIGENVPFTLLRAIAELAEDDLHKGLGRLQKAEFLYVAQLFPVVQYTFRHGLTHQVSYESLLQERRRTLHAAIVDAIERLYPTEQVEELAHHAYKGEVWNKAITYLRQAGMKAVGHSAYYEAAGWFERALEVHTKISPDRSSIEEAIELRFALRNALWPIGEFARILPHLLDAKSSAESLGDNPRIGRAYSYLTQYFWMMGEQSRAIESGQKALAIGLSLNDCSVLVPTNLHLGLAYHACGDYHRAIEVLKRNLVICQGDLAYEHFGLAALPSVYSRTWMGWSLAELGEFPEAILCGREEAEIADAAGHPLSRVSAYLGVGHVYIRKGEFSKAIAVLTVANDLCRTLAVPFWQPATFSLLGYAYLWSGRVAEGISLLENGVKQAVAMARQVDQALWSSYLGEAYVLAGRMDDASQIVGSALDIARKYGEKGNEAHTLRLIADIDRHRECINSTGVERAYDRALFLATDLRMRPLIAHCHFGLGKLNQRAGDGVKAHEHLSASTDLFREMEMSFWLQRAQAEMRALYHETGDCK